MQQIFLKYYKSLILNQVIFTLNSLELVVNTSFFILMVVTYGHVVILNVMEEVVAKETDKWNGVPEDDESVQGVGAICVAVHGFQD